MKPYTKVFLFRLTLYMVYIFGVSTIFMAIKKNENPLDPNSKIKGVYYLLKTNDTFDNLTEGNFTKMVAHAAGEDLCKKPRQEWNYSTCYKYATHLVTTIGYGTITPSTELGQMVTIIYAFFGIPLTMLTMKAMAFHFNQSIAAALSKFFAKDTTKKIELKIVIVNITVALLFWLISAAVSLGKDGYTYTQGLYAWFVTLTTIGLGDLVPEETSNPYNLLIGLCFMSSTIDSLVTFYDSGNQSSLCNTFKRCICRCCGSKTHSKDGDDDNVNQPRDEYSCSSKDASTQTGGLDIMNNYGISNDAVTIF